MQGDDPPYLPVGTDVSAKYKGAFCEAKVKKVVRNIKCKVTLKAGGSITVNDDVIKGTLRIGSNVEVKQDPKKEVIEAIITKIQDCSQYTVVFDDGDITTLRRSALCLKSGRHFNESETLDQLPLTHPEHFSTPVIAGRRGRRGRAQSEDSDGEGPSRPAKADSAEREPHVGRVVLVEAASGAERRRPQQPAFPALVVAPTAQIKVKEDYLVRSFKDGRYYTVPKKEAREFRKGSAPLEWSGVEAALQYMNNGVLPPHWDRDSLFNEPRNTSDDSSDDEPREEKDHFVAQLYKFMDDRGTPLNRNPTIANRDIDLYRLFRVVQKLGGYNRVTNQNQWKSIADKMGFHPVTTSITNLCKQAYKKFLHSFEDFYRKLGVTLVAHPRGARTPPAGRSLIRDRDKQPPTSSSAGSTPTGPTSLRGKDKDKDSDKSETDRSEKDDKSEKGDKKEKPQISDEEDSADNQPLIVNAPKILEKEKEKEREKEKEKEKEREREKEKEEEKEREKEKEKVKEQEKEKEKDSHKEREKSTSTTTSEEKVLVIKPRPRSLSKARTITPLKCERTPKRRPLSSKSESAGPSVSRASRRPHVSTDSDSSVSGRASRCGLLTKKMQSRRSQSANSASSGNTIASNSSKRPRKRKITEPSINEPTTSRIVSCVKAQVGDKLKVYYGPTQSESKVLRKIEKPGRKLARPLPSSRTSQVTYEAKVIEISAEGMLRVHYTGWNTRYDEWIKPQRIAVNVSQHEARNKKGSSMSRRVRAKRTEESSAISDSDTSDSDEDMKRPPKKLDDKSNASTPRSKDTKSSDSSSSSKPRKRPVRNVSTPTNVSPAKKPRPNAPSHQGRDYDLNEIRSELKGFNTVKQEPDEIKQETSDKDTVINPAQIPIPPTEPPTEKGKEEDVYEFKEPEPFELELHDEKKKRTHRIFDDISPSKYTATLSKSLSEEINEDPMKPRTISLRSPSLSPYRDFAGTSGIGKQSPEDDSKDDIFSLDDDSFHGDGSSGPTFEGFTPAKNQETYSKKSKVSKLRQLIDDSPDSPADDEQSSDDSEDIAMKEDDDDDGSKSVSPTESTAESKSSTSSVQDEPKPTDEDEPEIKEETTNASPTEMMIDLQNIPKPPNSPPPLQNIDIPMKIEVKKIEIAKKIELPKKPELAKKSEPPKKVETPKKIEPPKKADLSKKVEPTKKAELPRKLELSKKMETPKKVEPAKKEPTKKAELPKKIDVTLPKKVEVPKTVEPLKKIDVSKRLENIKKTEVTKKCEPLKKVELPENIELTNKIELLRNIELPKSTIIPPVCVCASTSILAEAKEKTSEEIKNENQIKLMSIPLPSSEPKERSIKVTPKKLDPEPLKTKLEQPSSPLIDAEEDKSEPDSPARIDVLPEPPPGFLLQSEGPKIAEKLLKAISSAKRLSMSPPPVDNRIRPVTPKTDSLKPATDSKLSPISPEPRTSVTKTEPIKPVVKITEPAKKDDLLFGELSNITDTKLDSLDVKKKEGSLTPRLQSPLNILERRKSVATDLPLSVVAGKNNKVLSDTIQKLSSQINQSAASVAAASVANIPLPSSSIPFLSEDRSESSDSDDSSRRLIIDKLTLEEWSNGASSEASRAAPSVAGSAGLRALHLGKSPGEWSAGESLLMLEDACKNERKHSASVVVAGSGRVASAASTSTTPVSQPITVPAPATQEEDSNISLLLCEETIPGSPAPDAEPAPLRQRPHMPFASAPPHHLAKDDRRGEGAARPSNGCDDDAVAEDVAVPAAEGAGGERAAGGAGGERPAGWGRGRLLVDNTPPTTPDSNRSSLEMSPQRERHTSERDSPSERKEEDENSRPIDASADMDKPAHSSRSRKASECSGAGASRGRRRARRDTDEHGSHNANSTATLKYNFFVELDPTWDCQTRINVLTTRLSDLRKTYHSVKAELAAIDRRRKKLRRKEREAVKAAKAACA